MLVTLKDEIIQRNMSVAKGGCGPDSHQGILRFTFEATFLWDPFFVSNFVCVRMHTVCRAYLEY